MIWSTESSAIRLNFALVVEEKERLRSSIVTLLRERGWLVHGISRAEQAFVILAHIPYSLIILDSELPGIGGGGLARIIRNSGDWRPVRLVVITSSEAQTVATGLAQCGAILVRRSRWQEDLDGCLSDCQGNPKTTSNCSQAQ
ncbi:MAG: response regulator [Verrucomicrobia bacterium]|nr:response regulator [Verrucomicrobiota bacterium]